MGRYLRVDPLGITGGDNLYEYCFGSPNNYYDEMGLLPSGGYSLCMIACYAGLSMAEAEAMNKGGLLDPKPSRGQGKPYEKEIRKKVKKDYADELAGLSRKKRNKRIAEITKDRARAIVKKKLKRKALKKGAFMLVTKIGGGFIAGPVGWLSWGAEAVKIYSCHNKCKCHS